MQHEQRRVVAPDGISLHVEQWTPSDNVDFVAVISHGGAEHVGRFARLAETLAGMGGLVVGLDHRGQGLTGGIRGHVEQFEDYASDLRHVMLDTASRLPEEQQPSSLPWFMFGHSMGGLIVLTYLLDHERDIPLRGAIISSPLLGLTMKVPPLKLLAGKLAARALPTLAMPSGIPVDAICRDPEEVRRYSRDNRRVRVVTAGWFDAMNQAITRVESEGHRIDLPLLLYVGTGDLICDHRATETFYGKLSAPRDKDQTLRSFEGYYHELHNEPENLRRPVLDMISSWIVERL